MTYPNMPHKIHKRLWRYLYRTCSQKSLKNNRTMGNDSLPADIVINCANGVIPRLLKLFLTAFTFQKRAKFQDGLLYVSCPLYCRLKHCENVFCCTFILVVYAIIIYLYIFYVVCFIINGMKLVILIYWSSLLVVVSNHIVRNQLNQESQQLF